MSRDTVKNGVALLVYSHQQTTELMEVPGGLCEYEALKCNPPT